MKTPWMRAFGEDPAPLSRNRRGAVYVEFLAVFFPLLTFFLGLVQMAFLQAATIIVQHSASKAVRTATLVMYDHPDAWSGDQGGKVTGAKRKVVEQDANIQLSTLGTTKGKVTFNDSAYDRNQPLTVTVDYDYTCRVPLGRIIACGLDGKKDIHAQATLPNQGADFMY